MTNVGGATNTKEAQSRNMMNICTKYGIINLIISGIYGGHRHDKRRTTDVTLFTLSLCVHEV